MLESRKKFEARMTRDWIAYNALFFAGAAMALTSNWQTMLLLLVLSAPIFFAVRQLWEWNEAIDAPEVPESAVTPPPYAWTPPMSSSPPYPIEPVAAQTQQQPDVNAF